MKKRIIFFLSIYLLVHMCFAQEAPAPQTPQTPPKQKVIIQTPFGQHEVEITPGQPLPPGAVIVPAAQTPPPAGQVAQPAPPPQTPAPTTVPLPPTPPPATPPAATPPAGAPQVPADEPANIALHFDNGDIYGVIKIIADSLNLNYAIDPAVKGTVNITTNSSVKRSELLPILETILKLNGATMVRNGNFYLIVPANAATHQSLTVQDKPVPSDPDDQMVLQIVRLKYVAASEMSKLLAPYTTEGANIVVVDSGSMLLVTERKSNLRKLLEIVDIFDSNAFEGERVRIFPVKQNLAKDLIPDLKTIFSGYALSDNSTAIRFLPIDRLNSILVITPVASVYPEVEKWIDRLDQRVAPGTNGGIRNYVYNVKNAKAADIQKVLGQLYGTAVQLSSIYQMPGNAVPASPAGVPPQGFTAMPNGSPTTAAQALAASAIGAPQGTQGGMAQAPGNGVAQAPGNGIVQNGAVKVIADEINNALVVQTSPQMWPDVERTIIDLDRLKRQVLIDAQIYEVTLNESLSFGLSAILQTRGTLANPNTGSFAGAPPSLTGQTVAYLSRSKELALFLNASENRSRVKTLSAPSVLVTDNLTAEFEVGADVPVPTSSSITPVTSGGTNLFAQTIQFRPTGVLLHVKPQINPSGNVTMEISEEVSEAGTNTTSTVAAPVIGKSSVNSTVVVQDGQTIAISGFIRESTNLNRTYLPLIGRIPILGTLLGNTEHSSDRTELIVLITPHVLQTHEDADSATDELKAKLKEIQKLLK
jgi:general secretion pathway protein D